MCGDVGRDNLARLSQSAAVLTLVARLPQNEEDAMRKYRAQLDADRAARLKVPMHGRKACEPSYCLLDVPHVKPFSHGLCCRAPTMQTCQQLTAVKSASGRTKTKSAARTKSEARTKSAARRRSPKRSGETAQMTAAAAAKARLHSRRSEVALCGYQSFLLASNSRRSGEQLGWQRCNRTREGMSD
jgi:hypothetical protein